jgi:hypothetical protein
MDGIFKSMLLLKKKKYAAVVIKEGEGGVITYEKVLSWIYVYVFVFVFHIYIYTESLFYNY